MTNEKAILEVLSILCENHRIKANKYLIMAWSIGLDDVSSEYIMRGLTATLKGRDNPFMPTVGEFRAFCLAERKKDVVELRHKEELKQIEMENQKETISYGEWKRRTFKNAEDGRIDQGIPIKKTDKT